jgi:L-amino acid N-acyltransferase YncA
MVLVLECNSEFLVSHEAYKFIVEHPVYVNDEYHGNGIGKLLLEELIVLLKFKSYILRKVAARC